MGKQEKSNQRIQINLIPVYHDAIVVIYMVISSIACSFEDSNMTYMASQWGVLVCWRRVKSLSQKSGIISFSWAKFSLPYQQI
jgi:hypothetical protein